MKILWFSNYRFSDSPDVRTGTWLGTMGRALVESGRCELVNIASAPVSHISRSDSCGVAQWLLPLWKTRSDGLPDKLNVVAIKELVDKIKPDILPVWGLESYHGLLVSRQIISGYRMLLDIQGIRFAVGRFFMGNLTIDEQRRCVGIKELLKRHLSPILNQQYYLSCRKHEIETIRGFDYISYQSNWSHDYISMLAAPGTIFYRTRMILRPEFMQKRWEPEVRYKEPRVVFAMCAGAPYKGLHVLIRAMYYLKRRDKRFNDVKLVVGGGFGRDGFFRSGYKKFVEREIINLGLQDDVMFVGAIDATQISNNLLSASVFVHPSFIESYSLSVAEAMIMGVPCVISYAGAMPELAVDGESALYYPAGDAVLCAERICRILDSDDLSSRLSMNAIEMAIKRNSHDKGIARQLEIYYDILGVNKNEKI